MNEYGLGHYQKKKNSQIHLCLETELHIKLKKQAADKCLSLSELCRQKMRHDMTVDKLESLVPKLEKMLLFLYSSVNTEKFKNPLLVKKS